MPISVNWYQHEQNTLVCDIHGRWTWDDFEAMVIEINNLAQSVPHEVSLLADFVRGSQFPRSSPFPHFQNWLKRLPRNIGRLVLVSDHTFVRMLVSILNRYNIHNHVVELMPSFHDAIALMVGGDSEQALKGRLLADLLNPDNPNIHQTLQDLRTEKWLYDDTLQGQSFIRRKLDNTDWFMANLQGADFTGASLQHATLYLADMRRANLTQANLENTNAIEANFEQALMAEAHLNFSDFSGANLDNADLQRAHLSEVILNGATMRHVNLSQANLHQARLANAILHQSILTGASMLDAVMVGADLSGADLSEAQLHQADLRNVQLTNATLFGATLMNANLKGANLQGANLTAVNLYGARLVGAIFDEHTILPDRNYWRPNMDMGRYNNPLHPDYWLKDKLAWSDDDTIIFRKPAST